MSARWYRMVRSFAAVGTVLLAGVLLLSGPASATPTPGSITGTVTLPAGTDSGCLVLYSAAQEELAWAAGCGGGGYTFSNVVPGTYYLYLAGFNGAALGDRFVGGPGDFAHATPVVVTSGAVTTVNVTVAAGPGVTGHVYAADGSTPVSGVGVSLLDQGRSNEASWSTTDASGYFAIGTTGLPSNQYTLRYDVGGGSTGWAAGDVGVYFWGGAYTLATAAQFPVSDGVSRTGYDLQLLASGGSISGQVTGSADPSGLGAVKVSVMRVDDPSSGLFGDVNSIPTDASGNYSVPGLPPGDYVVAFHVSDTSSYAPQVYSGASQFTDADVVTLGAGTSATGIDVELVPGATVSGRVVDQSNPSVGVASVEVFLVSADGRYFPPLSGRAFDPVGPELDYRALTDVDGYYTVDIAVPPGDYRVWFRPYDHGYAPAFSGGGISLTGADVLTVAGTSPVEANGALVPAGSISGQVTRDGIARTDAPGYDDGMAIAYAYDATAASWLAVAETEIPPDGTYSIPGLAPGDYKVGFYDRLSNTGYHPHPWVFGTPTVYFDAQADLASASLVTVTGTGDTSGVDALFTTYPEGVVLTDIAGNPFEADIQWMADQGISTGYSDGSFRPAANVSRQAMAAFMYRFAGSPGFTPPVISPFNDVATDSAFYTEICWMADQGISTGYADGGFHPTANVSRQAMAAFMYRFAGSPAFTPPVTSPFNDVATDSPFYAEVTWMADAAISTGYGDGGFHPAANVSRQAMSAFMHRLDGVLTAP